jgi:hypothetical protein
MASAALARRFIRRGGILAARARARRRIPRIPRAVDTYTHGTRGGVALHLGGVGASDGRRVGRTTGGRLQGLPRDPRARDRRPGDITTVRAVPGAPHVAARRRRRRPHALGTNRDVRWGHRVVIPRREPTAACARRTGRCRGSGGKGSRGTSSTTQTSSEVDPCWTSAADAASQRSPRQPPAHPGSVVSLF